MLIDFFNILVRMVLVVIILFECDIWLCLFWVKEVSILKSLWYLLIWCCCCCELDDEVDIEVWYEFCDCWVVVVELLVENLFVKDELILVGRFGKFGCLGVECFLLKFWIGLLFCVLIMELIFVILVINIWFWLFVIVLDMDWLMDCVREFFCKEKYRYVYFLV